MSNSPTRRQFLRQAGGVTFLALALREHGTWAADDASLPLFNALPYIQPGNNSALVPGKETQTIAWQTDKTEAQFKVEYGPSDAYGRTAHIARTERMAGEVAAQSGETHPIPGGYNYAAALPGLDLGKRYQYKLSANGKTIATGEFTTRKKRGEKIRFVSFGDNANGSPGERAIAYQAYQAHPDFIMNTGDNVYDRGRNAEYIQNFFPVYNADRADPAVGAPLLRSIPFYSVIANHDVAFHHPNGGPGADFDAAVDALGYYTNLHLPLNGPLKPTHETPLTGAADRAEALFAVAGERFPRMANYSFDYGDVHFLCLDSNTYVDPSDAALQAWITADLKATDAPWKFVIYHHPAYNAGNAHYHEQHMRVLSPLFEAAGVDFCLSGHEHVYQRAMPFRFQVKDATRVAPRFNGNRLIPGTFTCDREFDGKTKTKPNGVIYITNGAGGAGLYDPGFDDSPDMWKHPEDDHADYVHKFISSQHSCTVFDVSTTELTMTQIGEKGDTLDEIRVTKQG